MAGFIVFIVFVAIILIIVARMIVIVPQASAYVLERLGAFQAVWDVGLHIKVPFIDKVASRVTLKETVYDFQPQPVITKDNVTMSIDTVIFAQITDPKLYTYGIVNPTKAIENLTATTLRNIIGDLELDETLTSRDTINTHMRSILDEATDPWGIKINRVELKNIDPPEDIKNAMEKQMRAEREKREQILQAEGKKQSAVLEAQGEKEAKILRAQADKEAQILKAEGEKEAKIRHAEGEAEAILKVQEATAEGLKKLNASQPTAEVLTLKSYEAMENVAQGNATKLIIPSDLQGTVGLASTIKEVFEKK